jgi:hypothetical protein
VYVTSATSLGWSSSLEQLVRALEASQQAPGQRRTPTWSQNLLREQPLAQAQVGQAHALVRAGRALVFDTLEDAWTTVTSGKRLSIEQRAWLWLASTQAAAMAMRRWT